jgi:glycosyltransferase involved in cell wall biosynthesis
MSFKGLRVALVGPLPPPAGGMALQTRQLAELLEAEGAVVEVVRTNPPHRPAWVEPIHGVRALLRLGPYVVRLWRAARSADVFHVMANSGWSWHLAAAPAVWVAWLRDVPVLVNYRGGEAESFLARAVGRVRPTLRRTAVLAVPSRFLEEVFARHAIAARVLPNVIDLNRFRIDGRQYAVRADPHLVVARNLEAIYDVGTAIRAFALLRERFPGARLSIAGAGPEREPLERIARALEVGGGVRFTGPLDHAGIAELYRSADLMLNPSRVDNTPNALLEALAAGLPVVSTNAGGIPYLVANGQTALLCEPGDERAMADAALRLLADPAFARRIAEAGRADAERHAWSCVRETLASLYRECVAAHRPQARTA